MATLAQLARLGMWRASVEEVMPPTDIVVVLPTTGQATVPLTTLAAIPAGNLVTVSHGADARIKLRLGEPITVPSTPLPELAPGPGWSGLESDADSSPVDPDDTDAGKATAHILSIERPCITSDFVFIVEAHHVDGIAQVKAMINGGVEAISKRRTCHEVTLPRGRVVRVWGYAFLVKHSAFSQDGWVNIRVEATPKNPLAASKVIGPYLLRRKSGSPWDAEIEIDPALPANGNVRQPTLRGALDRIAANASWQHVRVWAGANVTHDLNTYRVGSGSNLFASGVTRKGRFVVEATGSGRIDLVCTHTSYVNMYGNSQNLVLGKGVKIDVRRIGGCPSSLMFHGCEIFNSDGYYEVNPDTLQPRLSSPINGVATHSLLDVYWHDQFLGPKLQARYLFNEVERIAEDAFTFPNNAVNYCCYGNELRQHSANLVRSLVNAMLLVGPAGSTVTSQGRLGNGDTSAVPNNSFTRRLVLKDGSGSVVATVRMSAEAGYLNYTVADVVAYINSTLGPSGWSATATNPHYLARYLGGLLVDDTDDGAYTNVPCDGAGVNVGQSLAVHGDGWQGGTATNCRNVLFVRNRSRDSHDIQWEFQDFNATTGARDFLSANNACDDNRLGGAASSQKSGHAYHASDILNTWSHQNWLLNGQANGNRYLPDAKCLHIGNLFARASITSPAIPEQVDVMRFESNYLMGGSPPPPGVGVSGNAMGSGVATILPNIGTGDFTPAGDLADGTRSILLPEGLMPYDIDGNPRATLTTPGAVENRAPVLTGKSFQLSIEWLRSMGLAALTSSAAPGTGLGSVIISGKNGPDETGDLVTVSVAFEVA